MTDPKIPTTDLKIQSPPRKPDLLLKVRVREGAGGPGYPDGRHATVGAAWMNADGSIHVQLHPGVTLAWNDGLQLTAFPNDWKDR